MTGKMTPSAFNKVIEQDIEWLEKIVSESDKCSSLEFSHIIDVLRYASKQYSDNGKRVNELPQSSGKWINNLPD
jgi:HD superfamily phosphodiesterase